MAASPIRLMLADVDGTLVTQDKVLTDEAIDAVHRLGEAGHPVRHHQRAPAPGHGHARSSRSTSRPPSPPSTVGCSSTAT